MFIHANLLPWRELRRKERKQSFFTAIGLSVISAVIVFFLFNQYVHGVLDTQKARITFLTERNAEMDTVNTEIRTLKKEKALFISRMEAIEALQAGRSSTVVLLEQLAKTTPRGVRLSFVKLTANDLEIKGAADSNSSVSSLMTNLDSTGHFRRSAIDKIQKNQNQDLSEFSLRVSVISKRDGNGESGESELSEVKQVTP